MALFTDGTIARIEDPRAVESAVLDLASSEGIDVSAKLRLAQRELGTELLPFLTRRGHRDLSRVVVTDALVSAHTTRTLTAIYRDLYQSRYNDRYEGKWREYQLQSERAMKALIEAGVGISLAPIPKAPSVAPTSVGGSLLPARLYCVQIGWTRAGRVTGELSDAASHSLGAATRLKVSAPVMPDAITGWMLFAGLSPEEMTLQTEFPLSAGTSWIEPEAGLRRDLKAWPIQLPDLYVENRREMLRG